MTEAPTATPNRRLVIAHAAIAFVIALALIGMAAGTFTSLSGSEALRAGAYVGLFAGIAAGIASYLSQRQRSRALVIGIAVGVLALGAGTFALLPHAAHPEAPPLPAADRAPLVVDNSAQPPRLRHPSLGFSFIKPDGFSESPQLVQVLSSKLGRNTMVYGFTNPNLRASLSVLIQAAPDNSPANLGRALDDFVHSMTAREPSTAVVDRAIGSNEGHIHVTVRGGHLRVVNHLVRAGAGWAYVMLVVGSTNATVLADVLASFAA